MSAVTLRYDQGATQPLAVITCTEEVDGIDENIDLSWGYSMFKVRVGRRGTTIFEEQSPAVTGTSTGVLVDWTGTGKLSELDPGSYVTTVVAVDSISSEERKFTGRLVIRPSLL